LSFPAGCANIGKAIACLLNKRTIMEQKFAHNNRVVMYGIVGFYVLLLLAAVIFTIVH
jgi:hypothetical protein